jgi:Fe-S-cluster-containing dehydrogenase component/CRP-like cAMP-binding protein
MATEQVVEFSDSLQVLQKPKRWDAPFSFELSNKLEARAMTEKELDELLSIPPFSDMDSSRFPASLSLRDLLRNDTRIRLYQKGDAVVRVGDYGHSAFLILSGSCLAVLSGLDNKHLGRPNFKTKSVFESLIGIFTNPDSPEEGKQEDFFFQANKQSTAVDTDASSGYVFVQDIPNVLAVDPNSLTNTKSDVMSEGTLFGELSALGRVKRNITVTANDPEATKVLEIRWQGLRDIMKYDGAFKEHINQLFRTRGLKEALRNSPLIGSAKLSESQWETVIAQTQFETHGSYDWYGSYKAWKAKGGDKEKAEPLIMKQGQYINSLVMIRTGFAKISITHGKSELTLGYLGKGEMYGLKELIRNISSGQPSPIQTTLRSAGYVDIVRIPTRTFEDIIFPNIPEEIKKTLLQEMAADELAKSTADENTLRADSSEENAVHKIDPAMKEFFAENRTLNGTATMLIDLERCTRCDDCVTACASGHNNNPRFVRHGLTQGKYMIANACMQCVDPVCMIGCPTGAIHRNEKSGDVVINQKTCIGCTTCANSCPYDNIRMVNVRDTENDTAIMVDPVHGRPIEKATKCDLCVEHKGGPACERACPNDALKRVNMGDLPALEKWMNR